MKNIKIGIDFDVLLNFRTSHKFVDKVQNTLAGKKPMNYWISNPYLVPLAPVILTFYHQNMLYMSSIWWFLGCRRLLIWRL